MKLINGIKQAGAPYRILDSSRLDLPELFLEMGYKTGAEIGVYKAEFTEIFCKAGLFMYAIDPWKAFYGQGRTQQVQKRQDFLYGHAQRVLAPYKNKKFIRKTSMDALADFKDESLDFVYIDGDHTFKAVVDDVCEWTKKVRVGGIVSGHDYWSTNPKAQNVICQVQPAIDGYVRAFGIDNWFVFGKDGRKDDKAFSWMWIKK